MADVAYCNGNILANIQGKGYGLIFNLSRYPQGIEKPYSEHGDVAVPAGCSMRQGSKALALETRTSPLKSYNAWPMSIHTSIERDASLTHRNTFRIPARAAVYLAVTDAAQLEEVRRAPDLMAMPRLVLGGGSNLLLTGDFPGLVLHLQSSGIELIGQDSNSIRVRAAAGGDWNALVDWTVDHGFGGLENLALIPGSVGASPVQNIGAYGVELKDRFHSLTAFDLETGDLLTLHGSDCRFGYRDSIFKHELRDRAVIVDVTFCLPKPWQPNTSYAELAKELASLGIEQPTARNIRDAVVAIRRRKLPDPAVIGNAGSFFKNPVVSAATRDSLLERHADLVSYPAGPRQYKLAAGWLIDRCGWKGRSIGDAAVYEKQALVLVNRGSASGQDILSLARAIQADVHARFGVMLEPEPVVV